MKPKWTVKRRGLALGAVVILVGLGMLRCTLPSDPGLPSWSVPIAIPLSTERYGLLGLVAQPGEIDSSGSGIDTTQGGILEFVFRDSIPETRVDPEQLRFSPEMDKSYIVETGILVITTANQREASIPLTRILPAEMFAFSPVDLDTGIIIPADSGEVVFEEFDSIRVVHVVDVDGGSMNLQLSNNTDLRWDTISVVIALNDAASGFPALDSVNFTDLGPRQTQSRLADLSGDSLKANVLMFVEGNGPPQLSVPIAETDELTFTINLDTLNCDYAEAILSGQEPQTNIDSLTLDQDDWIESAIIDSGYMYFELLNQTDVPIEISLAFLNFFSEEGSDDTLIIPLDMERAPSASEAFSRIDSVSLVGKQLRLEIPTIETDPQYILSRTAIRVLGSGYEEDEVTPRYAEVRSSDSVKTVFRTGEIKFGRIYGIAKSITQEIPEQVQAIDIWKEQPDVHTELTGRLLIEEAGFTFDLANSFGYPMMIIMNFRASNNQVVPPITRERSDTVWLAPSQDDTTITGIEELINIMPDSIIFSGMVQIGRDHLAGNPWGYDPYTAFPISLGDSLTGLVAIEAPYSLQINETVEVRPAPTLMEEPFDIPLDQIKLVTTVTNTIPLSGTVYLLAGSFVSEERARVNLTLEGFNDYGIMDPITIPLPTRDPITNRTIPITEIIEAIIDSSAISVFADSLVYVRQVLLMHPTIDENGDTIFVAARSSDYIDVTVTAEATYQVNEEPGGGR